MPSISIRFGYTEEGNQDVQSEVFKLLAKCTFHDPRYKLDFLENHVAEVIQQEISDEVKEYYGKLMVIQFLHVANVEFICGLNG